MKTGTAFLAGAIGATVMTILMAVARAFGFEGNMAMRLGTMFFEPGAATWLFGFAIQVVAGGIFGILYALGFEYITKRASAGLGMAFAVIHLALAGIGMAFIPFIHPMVPEVFLPYGAFMGNLGWFGIATFTVLHLVFGAVVGSMYRPVHRGVPRRAGI